MFEKLEKTTQTGLFKKHVLIGLISFFAFLLFCQLIAQLYTIRQLDKVSGKVVSTGQGRTSYTSGSGGRYSKGSPNYSIFVELDNGKSYNIETNDAKPGIAGAVTQGKQVTIYNPTILYNILSLDIIDPGDRVSQVEADNQVWYSFDQHQHKNRGFIYFFAGAVLLFSYFLYDYYKNG
jgi:hypothetical protein